MPASIYWKDMDGCYLEINPFAKIKMQELGYQDVLIQGKTDYDLFSKNIADLFRENDERVIKSTESLIAIESCCMPDNLELIQLSVKQPLYNHHADLIGTMGMTYDLTHLVKEFISPKKLDINKEIKLTKQEKLCAHYVSQGKSDEKIAALLNKPLCIIEAYVEKLKIKFSCYHRRALIEFLIANFKLDNTQFISLTKREEQIAHLLKRGLSYRMIAIELALSARTVEHYIENMKEKYNVYSKYALINKLMEE